MILAVLVVIIGIGAVSVVFGNSDVINQYYMSPTSTLGVFSLHSLFGILTLISGVWMVALWRPSSSDFAARSKKIWRLTISLWTITFLVGIVLYAALTTTYL